MVRDPAVAGQFYPGSKESLLKELGSMTKSGTGDIDAIGAISPHAGYPYSGSVAGATIGSLKAKRHYIIMGPNHTGMGQPFGISSADSWKTPLGKALIDKPLADEIVRISGYVKYDDLSCLAEHSVEVQIPFLQFLNKDFSFVPIIISYADLAVYRSIGSAIAEAIKRLGLKKETAIIASTDMSHYEPSDTAKEKDGMAIDAILNLDESALVDKVSELDISMCGYAPVAIMIAATKELGATEAKLVRYANSGDVTGDYSSVVGYAGVIIR